MSEQDATAPKTCQVLGREPTEPPPPGPDGRPSFSGVQRHRFWLPSENRFVRIRISAEGIQLLRKRGIEAVVAEIRARGDKL